MKIRENETRLMAIGHLSTSRGKRFHPGLSKYRDENLTYMDGVTVYFDGAFYAADGGEMYGIVMMPDEPHLFSFGKGYDNNEAEWRAAIAAVELCLSADLKSVELVGDSKIVIDQANGDLGCHCVAHVPHFKRLQKLSPSLLCIKWRHVLRKDNPAGRELSRRQRRRDLLRP